MPTTIEHIQAERLRFTESEGTAPNILLVSPQAETELYALGLRPGSTILGMRIVADDTIDGIEAARRRKP